MKFFIDTANLDQIREAYDMGVLDGVTTNPSLMAKEGIKGVENQRKHYVDICNIVQGDVSAEVIATDYEGMIKEGEELAALNPHIVVKVPCIADGIYNPQIQISAESETKRSIFREKDKTKRSKKESAQHSKSRNKSFVMTSVSAL